MGLAVGLLLAGVVFLLAIPLDLDVFVGRDEALHGRVRVRWLFGLVRCRLPAPSGRARPSRDESRDESRERPRRRGTRAARRVALALMRPELRARALRFARSVLRALRPRDVRIRARIGLDDPADTGRLWAVLGPLGAQLRDVELEPDFCEAGLRFRAVARVRVVPLQLLALTVAFALSPPVVRTVLAR